MKKSRRKTRQCLFQALYSRVYLQDHFDKDTFIESFFDDDFKDVIDLEYFDEVFAWVIDKEREMLYIIKRFAPKFDINSMPLINLIPIFIASYELLFIKCDTIPYKVSIDEALELTKIYSDDQARILVNWVLNSLKDNKDSITKDFEKSQELKTIFFNRNP